MSLVDSRKMLERISRSRKESVRPHSMQAGLFFGSVACETSEEAADVLAALSRELKNTSTREFAQASDAPMVIEYAVMAGDSESATQRIDSILSNSGIEIV